jgi:hypothetical protein
LESGIERDSNQKNTHICGAFDVTNGLPGDIQIQLRRDVVTKSLFSETSFFRMTFLKRSNIEEGVRRIEANRHQGRQKTTVRNPSILRIGMIGLPKIFTGKSEITRGVITSSSLAQFPTLRDRFRKPNHHVSGKTISRNVTHESDGF